MLDVKITDKGADCILQAAGGQLPIRINGQDDLEIHQKFGVDLKTMVNTNADKIGQPSATKDPVEFSITGKFSSAADVKIEVKKDDGWHELYAKKGETACKILVNTNFEWPDERQSLKAKYPKFVDWVNDPTNRIRPFSSSASADHRSAALIPYGSPLLPASWRAIFLDQRYDGSRLQDG